MSPVDPGFLQRSSAGRRFAVSGDRKVFGGWFGPSEPLPPLTPPSVEGRQFDYPFGVNLQSRPRANESITFDTLRGLADSYDLLRLVIETRKDQMEKQNWQIRCKEGKGSEKRAEELTEFFQFPDKVNTWNQWLRAVLEDLFVIDAPTAYNHRTLGNKPYAIELIDGSTIQRLVGEDGRTPLEGPAYQQILKGIKAVDYTREELLYMPRNVRTNRLYGFSPVEQVMMTVNIAIRRQVNQLQYYTEGNTPDLIIGLPKEWQPSAVKQFQEWWNSMINSVDQTERRKTRFVPEGLKVIDTKERTLKDEYDEWLARVICYAFSVSPQALVAQMNRATAETAQESALQEGLAPIMNWTKSFMDSILLRFFQEEDYEFSWIEEQAIDPLVQAQIHEIQLRSGLRSVDEIREEDLKLEPKEVPELPENHEPVLDETGKPKLNPDGTPVTQPKADLVQASPAAPGMPNTGGEAVQDTALSGIQITSLLAVTAAVGDTSLPKPSAIALLTAAFPAIDPAVIAAIINPIEAKEPPPPPVFGGGFGAPKNQPPVAGQKTNPLGEKDGSPSVPPIAQKPVADTSKKLAKAAKPMSMDRPMVAKTEAKLRAVWKKWLRAQVNPIASKITETLGKSEETDRIEAVIKSIGFKNSAVVRDTAQRMMEAVARDANYEALQKIAKNAADYEKMLSQANTRAAEWAAEQAGKAVTEIEDSTRDMLRTSVEQAINDGLSTADLADLLADNYAFGDSRAETIARTELAEANVQGTVEAYKVSGVVDGITWLVAQDEYCDECEAMVGKVGTLEEGVEGEFPPLHPNCRCDVVPVLSDEPEKLLKAGLVKPTIVQIDMAPLVELLKGQSEILDRIASNAVKKVAAPKNINFTYDESGRIVAGNLEN